MKAVENYADMMGVPPELVRDEKAVNVLIQQEAQDAQAQKMMEMAQQGASTAKDLSQAQLGDNNALAQLMGRMGQAPQGV
jgi:hypothetical protein